MFRRYWDRPLGAKLVVLLDLAFLLVMFAPWQRVCQVTSGGGEPICGWRTAYEGSNFGAFAGILAVAILVWELLPIMFPKLSMRGWPTAVITAILGIALTVSVLVKVIVDNEFQQTWAWIGLALALAIMLTALIRVRFRWETRHSRPAPSVERGTPTGPGEPPVAP